MKIGKEIIHELKHHIPFTLLATLIAVVASLFLFQINISKTIFEILHPLHIVASAIVTSALFYSYKKNFVYAVFVGVLGAIVVGSLSDVIFPYLGGLIFQFNPIFHFPLIEMPLIILGTAILGGLIGVATGLTKFPHFVHVFLSVFASLFYILAFSSSIGWFYFILAFIVVFISVIIPCCLSDIIFPFLFLGEKIKKCDC